MGDRVYQRDRSLWHSCWDQCWRLLLFPPRPSSQDHPAELRGGEGGLAGEKQPPALPRTKALLTLPTPRQRELGHMMGARWQV